MPTYDLICLSHLRWDFVFQRPQHLMTRCAQARRVFYFEEPVRDEAASGASLSVTDRPGNVRVAVPVLPATLPDDEVEPVVRRLVDEMLERFQITRHVLWYYTPMALGFTDHLEPQAVVYDCMDELSAFRFAPQLLKDRERMLFGRASVVFTGGQSLYEAKRAHHPNVHAFPSSVDVAHFRQAREALEEPADQRGIAHPRFGFYGVVDERFDIALLDGIARLRPAWQFVIIGPVAKIDRASLPGHANIHYLGQKKYDDLPRYLAGWDAALLLFARNESTRYISPTKTPEYLAAGRPVVSTSIRDVVRPYEALGLVHVADDAEGFVEAIERALHDDRGLLLEKADAFLGHTSWDHTWRRMAAHVDAAVATLESEGVPEYV